jgi:hypothetical protein
MVCGYNTDALLLDVGTPERLTWIEEFLQPAPSPPSSQDALEIPPERSNETTSLANSQ